MSLPGYDAWLERPYVEAAKQAEAFESYCEENDLDPETDYAVACWEAFLDEVDEIEHEPDPDDARDREYEEERTDA